MWDEPGGWTWDGRKVEVRRSARRRRTVAAQEESGRWVLLVPAVLPDVEVRRAAEKLLPRVVARRAQQDDPERLLRRARALNVEHFGGRATPASVRWVPPMVSRWASCTPSTRTIRVSDVLRGAPAYVLDSVLVHELAHLLEPGHGPRFQALVTGDPHLERANAYLAGLAHGARLATPALGAEPPEDALG